MVELLEKMSGKHVLCNFSKKYEICSEVGCFFAQIGHLNSD